jgi:hypothetical protein
MRQRGLSTPTKSPDFYDHPARDERHPPVTPALIIAIPIVLRGKGDPSPIAPDDPASARHHIGGMLLIAWIRDILVWLQSVRVIPLYLNKWQGALSFHRSSPRARRRAANNSS